MATPERVQQRRSRAEHALDYIAREYGTEKQLQRFRRIRAQPTYGDPDFGEIFTLEAVWAWLEDFTGIEVPAEVFMEEEQVFEYNPDAEEGEPQEWQPSHLSGTAAQGQGQIPEEVAEAVRLGDAEGQVASEETQDLPEEEVSAESDVGTDEPTATDEGSEAGEE